MSTAKPTGGPAFPVRMEPSAQGRALGGEQPRQYAGMDLRDYFAAKAMQARLSRQPDPLPAPQWFQPGHEIEDARSCYAIADAMLAARNEESK